MADAFVRVSEEADPRLIAMLRMAVADESARPWARWRAAFALARSSPADAALATSLVLPTAGQGPSMGQLRYLLQLAQLGGGVVPKLRTLLAAPDTGCAGVVVASTALAQLSPDIRDEMISILRGLATDELLSNPLRADAAARMVDIDPATRDLATALYLSALTDESMSITERCGVAYNLVQIDHGSIDRVCLFFRRCARSPLSLPGEQASAVSNLMHLWAEWAPTREIAQLAASVAYHPNADGAVRHTVGDALRAEDSRELQDATLVDPMVPLTDRVPRGDILGYIPHAFEVESVLREVLVAPEARLDERTAAAVALGRLAPRFRKEAIEPFRAT